MFRALLLKWYIRSTRCITVLVRTYFAFLSYCSIYVKCCRNSNVRFHACPPVFGCPRSSHQARVQRGGDQVPVRYPHVLSAQASGSLLFALKANAVLQTALDSPTVASTEWFWLRRGNHVRISAESPSGKTSIRAAYRSHPFYHRSGV